MSIMTMVRTVRAHHRRFSAKRVPRLVGLARYAGLRRGGSDIRGHLSRGARGTTRPHSHIADALNVVTPRTGGITSCVQLCGAAAGATVGCASRLVEAVHLSVVHRLRGSGGCVHSLWIDAAYRTGRVPGAAEHRWRDRQTTTDHTTALEARTPTARTPTACARLRCRPRCWPATSR